MPLSLSLPGNDTPERPGSSIALLEQPDVESKADSKAPKPASRAEPAADWKEFFDKPVDPNKVRDLVRDLTESGRHEDVISLIEQAIIHGQIQPWMYEALALTMEIAGRPPAQTERVLMSSPDLIAGDSDSFLYLAAYLTRFGRYQQALHLYQQVALAEPYRVEAYVMGLGLAEKLQTPADVAWIASGILSHAWGADRENLHRRAEQLAAQTQTRLQEEGRELEATALSQVMAEARQRDLQILLDWNGNGDIDLEVTDPTGVTVNSRQPATPGGLLHVHSGQGPRQEDCFEEVVAPRALPGEYRILVKHVSGDIVSKRTRLTIVRQAGSPREERVVQAIPLTEKGQTIRILLKGRLSAPIAVPLAPKMSSSKTDGGRAAMLQRIPTAGGRDAKNRPAGAVTANVGYQPVIANIPSGAQMSALAIVSGDRRYVRLSMSPTFSNITDVFTFSFVNGGGQP